MGSIRQRLEILESKASETTERHARSPSIRGIEDEIVGIRTQQKEQKGQIANLSNTFVSHKEHEEALRQISTLQKSLNTVEEGTVKAQQSLTKLEALPERLLQIQHSAQIPDDFTKLQNEVKNLSRFSGHYQIFYDKTQEELKLLNAKAVTNSDSILEAQGSLSTRLKHISEVCGKVEKAVGDCAQQTSTVEERGVRAVADLRKHTETWRASMLKGIDSSFTQTTAAVANIKELKTAFEQTSHSIQSLDTRYSSISTQRLYHSIIATIQPLIPRLCEVPNQLRLVGDAVAAWEQKLSHLQSQIKSVQASGSNVVGRLGEKEASTPTRPAQAVQAFNSSENRSISEENRSAELTKIIECITGFESAQKGYLGEFHKMCEKLTVLEATAKSQQQSLQELARLCDDLKQKEESTDASMEVAIVEEQTRIRESLEKVQQDLDNQLVISSDQSKTIDALRADFGMIDDLQTRSQNLLTDVTMLEQQISKMNPALQRLEEQLERKPTGDQLGMEGHNRFKELQDNFMKLREDFENSNPDEQLRFRLESLEEIVFPQQDRFIVCQNVASVINDARICEYFPHFTIKAIKFKGGRLIGSKTTRLVLVCIASAPSVDAAIASVIQAQNGKPWSGRRVVISRIERNKFLALWRGDLQSDEPTMPAGPSSRSERASEMPSVAMSSREMSTVIAPGSELPEDDTIKVKSTVRSSVLPNRKFSQKDAIELRETSDAEDLLGQFGASRNGQKSTKPRILKEEATVGLSTPLVEGEVKRGRSGTGSSRPSKRKRRG